MTLRLVLLHACLLAQLPTCNLYLGTDNFPVDQLVAPHECMATCFFVFTTLAGPAPDVCLLTHSSFLTFPAWVRACTCIVLLAGMGCQCFRASQFNARPHPRHDGDGTRGTQRLPSWYSSGGATDITDTTRGSGGGVPSCAMDSDAGFTMLGPGMPPENAPKKSKMGHSSGGGAGGFSAGGAAPHYTYGFDPHMASDVLRANTGGSTGTPSSFQTIAPVTPLTHTYTNSSMVSATPSAAAAASLPPYGPADYFGAAGDEGPWAEAPQPQQASAPPAPAPMLPPPSAWSQEWVPSGSPYPNIDGTARIQ